MQKIPSYRKKTVRTAKGVIAYAIVKLGGKVIHLGRWGTKCSKQKYKQVIAEWMAGGKIGDDGAEEVSVAEVCVDYTNAMKKRYCDADGNPMMNTKTSSES